MNYLNGLCTDGNRACQLGLFMVRLEKSSSPSCSRLGLGPSPTFRCQAKLESVRVAHRLRTTKHKFN